METRQFTRTALTSTTHAGFCLHSWWPQPNCSSHCSSSLSLGHFSPAINSQYLKKEHNKFFFCHFEIQGFQGVFQQISRQAFFCLEFCLYWNLDFILAKFYRYYYYTFLSLKIYLFEKNDKTNKILIKNLKRFSTKELKS